MYMPTTKHRELMKSIGMTEAEINDYIERQNTPLYELLARYKKPLKFDIDLNDFFEEMGRLGWKKEDAESCVKSILPDVDDAEEVVLIKHLICPAPEKEIY